MAVVPEDVLKARKAAETKLDKMLSDFEKAHDTATDKPGKNLRQLLDNSPDLKARIVESVQKGHLEKFDMLPAGANAGGTYNSDNKTIELPPGYLKKAGTDKSAASELVFVMGHEIQHSFNSTVSDKAVDKYIKDVDTIAKGPGPHDYTGSVKTLIDSYRKDEAGAHIGGYNAIVSQVAKQKHDAGDNTPPTLKELYNAQPGRMGDFIERSGTAPSFTYAMKPGLTIEADMTLKSTDKNVEAMGKHYFDQPPSSARLGTKGNQDYPNYYGEWALGVIDNAEKKALADAKKHDPKATAPEVKLDLHELHLKKNLMDTGLHYTDSSPKKPVVGAHEGPHATGSGFLIGDKPFERQDPYGGGIPFLRPEDAAKAAQGNPFFGQAMKSVGEVLPQLGLKSEAEHINVAAATALQAMKSGMERIDGVLVGKNGNFFAYQGDPASESADRIAVNVQQAKQQPAHQSLATMAAAEPQQGQTQQQPPRSMSM